MTTPRDDVPRHSAARERVQELAHAHGFDGDGDAQQAIYDALLAYAGEERDALGRALVAEYTAAHARSGSWRARWSDDYDRGMACAGACDALQRVADRLGVTDLHDQAAEVGARGEAGT